MVWKKLLVLILVPALGALSGEAMLPKAALAGDTSSNNTRFILTGVNPNLEPCTTCPDSEYQINFQFSDDELSDLAANYSHIAMTKYHANWDLERQFDDAVRLKQLNPNLKVYMFFVPTVAYFASELYSGTNQHEDWFLHQGGSRIPFKTAGYYVDYSSPAFQAWFVDQIVQWAFRPDANGNQVIDGVLFDMAQIYDLSCMNSGSPGCQRVQTLAAQVGTAKISALNLGMKKLAAKTRNALGPNKAVLYNGIENFDWAQNNSLSLQGFAGGALNEQFGFYGSAVSKQDMIRYINIPYRFPGRYFFEKCNLPAMSSDQRSQALRRVYGCFLLSLQPGYSFFKVGTDYTVQGELPTASYDVPESHIDFGNPLGKFVTYRARVDNGVMRRDFEKGYVLVNLESNNLRVGTSRKIQICNGNVPGAIYNAGQIMTIPAGDALFCKYVQ